MAQNEGVATWQLRFGFPYEFLVDGSRGYAYNYKQDRYQFF